MITVGIDVNCPTCAGVLWLVAKGTQEGRELRGVLECKRHHQFVLQVTLTGTNDVHPEDDCNGAIRRVAICGTDPGYGKHCRERSTPCDACKAAHARAESARKRARAGKIQP